MRPLALALVVGTATPAAAGTAPALVIEPVRVDAGGVELDGAIAVRTVELANTGGAPLQIHAIQIVDAGVADAAGDWHHAMRGPCETTPCVLGPGEAATLEIAFDPSELHPRPATLLVGYHDTAARTARISLRGTGSGATLERLGAGALDFGVVARDAPSALAIHLANTGNRDLSDAALTVMPAGSPFVVPADRLVVGITGHATAQVTCRSSAPGVYTATLIAASPAAATSPIEIPLRCEVRDAPVVASPSALQLGELRVGSEPAHLAVALAVTGGPVPLADLQLVGPAGALAVVDPVPTSAPGAIALAIAPQVEGPLDGALVVTPAGGEPLAVPITGAVVTASYIAPTELQLGTFCVGQPTTPIVASMVSTGTATIALARPSLVRAPSPFTLEVWSPASYPALLGPGRRAMVELTAVQSSAPGDVTDELRWTTDVATAPVHATAVRATFIDEGAAIAPAALAFGEAPIHLDIENAQQVTLQNCGETAIDLGPPSVPPPFSLEGPPAAELPRALAPGESAVFAIGFHPVKLGRYEKKLEISSPQLAAPLVVVLTGEGITGQGGETEPIDPPGPDETSFYSCGGCSSNDPTGALAGALVCLLIARRRRT